MSPWIKLLGIGDRLVWNPLDRLNKMRQLAEFRAKKNASTMASLRKIESFKGKTNPSILKRCDDYSFDVFGWRGYAPSLYLYSALAGDFREGWVPGLYYDLVVVPVTSGNFGDLSMMKSLGGDLIKTNRFPDI